MSDGIRTRDRRDHNPELYQLSYAHQASFKSINAAERYPVASGCSTLWRFASTSVASGAPDCGLR